jgi:beta-N-acetylhexosaminidase
MSLGPLMIDLRGTTLNEDEREWLQHPALGGVILFTRNFESPEQLAALIDDIHAARKPQLLVAVDQEGGRVQRFRAPFTELPPLRALGHFHDMDRDAALKAAGAFGWLMGAELRAFRVDLGFTPVVDLDLGLAEVIGDRALHADAQAVSDLAARIVEGATRAGLATCAKHFPSHAGAVADSHLEVATDNREFVALREDLAPYRHLISRGLHAVMLAHVKFPAIDPRPASMSPWWVGTALRGRLGFSGAVISDDMSMRGAEGAGGIVERIRLALQAGCDLVLLCNAPDEIPAALDSLKDYVSPPGKLRLMRLRGTASSDWETLRGTPAWRQARRLLHDLMARPTLSLEG